LPRASSQCDDFLDKLHKKPGNLEFVGCNLRADLQGEPWEATYRMAGSQAAAVESYLAKELHIKKLRRTCCVWESARNTYRDKQSGLFVISMSSDETPISNRNQWVKIVNFYVTMNHYREDP